MPRTMVLIDGTNYAFRAFYAIPSLTNSKHFPTNALHGFANMLVHYQKNERPDYLAVTFDAAGPTFRKEQFDAYKAQRRECPPDLVQQMPLFRKLTEAFSIPFLELGGYEADDIVATIVSRASHEDLSIRIISMDKDLMQLVNDQVTVVDTLRNKVYDAQAVEEKWGVPPSRLRDLLALQGDQSDNIPGVPGIGPKKARDLLLEFGTLFSLLENLDKVSNARMRETLQNNVALARLSLELVTLDRDVPLLMPLESLRLQEPDPDLCRDLFRELEFNRLLKEFGRPDETPVLQPAESTALPDAGAVRAYAARIREAGQVVLRTQGDGDPLKQSPTRLGLRIPGDSGTHWLGPEQLADPSVREALGVVLSDPAVQKTGHDLKQDLLRLGHLDLPLTGLWGDVMIASYLVNPSRSAHTLEVLARTLLDRDLSGEKTVDQLALEIDLIPILHQRLEEDIEKSGMSGLYRDMELRLIPVLAGMERAGITLDVERLQQLSVELESRAAVIEHTIHTLAGGSFNPNSPKQLQTILFEKLGLPVTKKTRTGPSTDQSVLEELASHHELPARILEYRSLVKLKNTYVDTLASMADRDHCRVNTHFNQTVAETGRLSSSDPNLQNIPIRSEEGRKIRAAFVAPPGFKLISADYSQIELRLLAHLSGDDALIEAFASGRDIHATTAAEMFGVMQPLVSSEMRRSAKAINFGILYGMGAYRLARELKVTRKEAEAYIERYFARYGKVRAFLESTVERARADGYVLTWLNRRRYIPELSASNFNERQGAERIAVNTPIQGSAADIIKLAMLAVTERIQAAGLATRMLLQVHDELVFEAPDSEVSRAIPLIREAMEGVATLKVSLVVDVGVSQNWAEAH